MRRSKGSKRLNESNGVKGIQIVEKGLKGFKISMGYWGCKGSKVFKGSERG